MAAPEVERRMRRLHGAGFNSGIRLAHSSQDLVCVSPSDSGHGTGHHGLCPGPSLTRCLGGEFSLGVTSTRPSSRDYWVGLAQASPCATVRAFIAGKAWETWNSTCLLSDVMLSSTWKPQMKGDGPHRGEPAQRADGTGSPEQPALFPNATNWVCHQSFPLFLMLRNHFKSLITFYQVNSM